MLLPYRIFLLCFFILFLLSSCPMMRFERHRVYFPISIDNLYKFSREIENAVFDKYTINGTKFILIAEPYWYDANWEDIRKNITGCNFSLGIYTKAEYTVTYRLLKATIDTSSFTMDININEMESNEVIFVSSETATRSDGYKVEVMLSNTYPYRFPCPKDMKYSLTVLIEEEKEDGSKSVYEFKYSYFFEKKDHWIRLIA